MKYNIALSLAGQINKLDGPHLAPGLQFAHPGSKDTTQNLHTAYITGVWVEKATPVSHLKFRSN